MIIRALKRAGWGPLAGHDLRGLRGVLEGLAMLLDDVSGMGEATAYQVAEAAGYSERWTRDRLYALEALDLIVYRQGGIRDGVPSPSWFRICRDKLVALLATARDLQDAAIARRREETAARIRGLRQVTVWRRKSKRWSGITAGQVHEALNTDLLSDEEPSQVPSAYERLVEDRKDLAGARAPYERANAGGRLDAARAVTADAVASDPSAERKPIAPWVREQYRALLRARQQPATVAPYGTGSEE